MATSISSFSNWVARDIPKCPRTIIDSEVVEAIIAFCEETYIMNESFQVSVLSTDINTALNDSVSIDISSIVSTTMRPHAFMKFQIDGADWYTKEQKTATDLTYLEQIQYSQTKFFEFTSNTTILMYPLDATDQTLFMQIALKYLSTITQVEDYFYDDYRRAIVAKAKAEVFKMPDKPWSDKNKAMEEMATYMNEKGGARLRLEHGYNKGSLSVKPVRWC